MVKTALPELRDAILGNSLDLVNDILKRSLPTPAQSLSLSKTGIDFAFIDPEAKSDTDSFSSYSKHSVE